MKCQLRVTRKVPTGLLKLSGNANIVSDHFSQIKWFYRYTGGYRPWLIDYTFDVCDVMQGGRLNVAHKFVERVYKGLKQAFPDILRGCPYKVNFFF